MRRIPLLAVLVGACSYQPPAQDLASDGPPADSTDAPPDGVDFDGPPDTATAFWKNTVGVAVAQTQLTKSTTTAGWGDSGASSAATVTSGDCFVEFTTLETTAGKALGLSNGDDTQSYTDIDFDFVLGANKKVYIYEGPVLRLQPTTYVVGDVFRIEIVGGVVRYLKNGGLLSTSLKTPTYPLSVDAALFSPGATIDSVTFVNQ